MSCLCPCRALSRNWNRLLTSFLYPCIYIVLKKKKYCKRIGYVIFDRFKKSTSGLYPGDELSGLCVLGLWWFYSKPTSLYTVALCIFLSTPDSLLVFQTCWTMSGDLSAFNLFSSLLSFTTLGIVWTFVSLITTVEFFVTLFFSPYQWFPLHYFLKSYLAPTLCPPILVACLFIYCCLYPFICSCSPQNPNEHWGWLNESQEQASSVTSEKDLDIE